jgi:hypothetical protein
VRVFDRDQPGQSDDDLTITAGKSDRQGIFSVEYDPSRFMDSSQVSVMVPRNPPYDWTLVPRTIVKTDSTDTFQPYLQFTYPFNGQNKSVIADLKSGIQIYTLPDNSPRRFLPSQNGWKFVNAFSGYFLPFSLPTLGFLGNPTSIYGLCGGMSAGALDMFLANRTMPTTTSTPQNGTPIQRYLYQRQMDSFGAFGALVMHFVEWMGLPDGGPQGTQKITFDEFTQNIKPRLEKNIPTPIAIQYVKWTDTHDVFQNHQVLAYRYDTSADGNISVFVYDPNYPNRDDVRIETQKIDLGSGLTGLSCVQHIGNFTKKMYGFFQMSYQPTLPPIDF